MGHTVVKRGVAESEFMETVVEFALGRHHPLRAIRLAIAFRQAD
jgi:hypothetical protein